MTPSDFETIRVETQDGVASLILSRPESRNALNLQMCRELVAACELLDRDESVRVILFRGAGDVFCAGADLKERKTMTASDLVARRVDGFIAYASIERLRKPSIAVVHGPAFGSGCEIAGACDFVLASSEAVFCYPEVGWGTVGATQRLPRIVGRRMAKELLFTGRKVGAEEAKTLGLVNQIYSPHEFEGNVLAMAARIAKANPLTVALTKRSIDEGLDTNREGAMAQEILAIQENLRGSDWQKAIAGFGAASEKA